MPITAGEVCSRFIRGRSSKYDSTPTVKIVDEHGNPVDPMSDASSKAVVSYYEGREEVIVEIGDYIDYMDFAW